MELPDDYFGDDDAAEDNTQTIRRWMEEETNAMTLFMLEDEDAGETLRIANDCGQCAGTGSIDSGAPTPWGDYYEVGCPSCDGTGRLEGNRLAVTVTDAGGAATIFLTPGQAELLATWLLNRNQADE